MKRNWFFEWDDSNRPVVTGVAILIPKPRDWLILLIAAAVPRLLNLGTEAFWYDEAFTASVARLDLAKLIAAVRSDVHPPLFYLVEWLTTRTLGSSEFALRFPSAIFGVIGVLLLWRIALDLQFDRKTALIAGLLAAVLPSGIYYGQEARMYALLVAGVLCMVWAALRGNWLALLAGAVVTVYTQNLGVLYVIAVGTVLLVTNLRSRNFSRTLVILGLVVIAWLPQASAILSQVGGMGGFWMQPLTPGGLLWPFTMMIAGWRQNAGIQIPLYTATMGITVLTLIQCRQWLISPKGAIILAAVIIPPALAAVVSFTVKQVYLPRAFMPSTTLLMLVWAWTLTHVSPANRTALAAVIIPIFAIGTIADYLPTEPRSDARQIAALIDSQWHEGDSILFLNVDTATGYGAYLDRPFKLWDQVKDRNASIVNITKTYFDIPETTLQALTGRIWVISLWTPTTHQQEITLVSRLIDERAAQLVYRRVNETYDLRVLIWQ